eukprot:8912025-Pyramimonas_sp.AAC.1
METSHRRNNLPQKGVAKYLHITVEKIRQYDATAKRRSGPADGATRSTRMARGTWPERTALHGRHHTAVANAAPRARPFAHDTKPTCTAPAT